MTTDQSIRRALEQAKDDLLEGRVPGPLTSIRLVELAGVKRHRLTHDNPDINEEFQRRARAANRTKPEVDRIRAKLDNQLERNKRLVTERDTLKERLDAYASALLGLLEEHQTLLDERDNLLEAIRAGENVTAMASRREGMPAADKAAATDTPRKP